MKRCEAYFINCDAILTDSLNFANSFTKQFGWLVLIYNIWYRVLQKRYFWSNFSGSNWLVLLNLFYWSFYKVAFGRVVYAFGCSSIFCWICDFKTNWLIPRYSEVECKEIKDIDLLGLKLIDHGWRRRPDIVQNVCNISKSIRRRKNIFFERINKLITQE